MGLVQASNEDLDNERHEKVQDITITWDRQVERMTHFYGELLVDYVKYFTGGRFIVAFSGASGC